MGSLAASRKKDEYAEYLATPGWRTRRNEAIVRAEGRCQLCNGSKQLQVHHRTYERVGNERPTDLTVLCRKCHEHFHGVTTETKALHVVQPPKARRALKREASNYKRRDEFALDRTLRDLIGCSQVTIKSLRNQLRSRHTRAEIKCTLDRMLARGELHEPQRGYYIKRDGGPRQTAPRPKRWPEKEPLPPKTYKPWDRQTMRDLEFREAQKNRSRRSPR